MAAAQDFCQAEPGEAEAGLRIALHVWLLYYWNAGHVSEGRYRLGQVLARAGEPTIWRARGLLLAGFLAAISGDRGAARPLLAQGTGLAGQLDDPATRAFAAFCAGHVCLFTGDLQQAIAHCEDGLAVLPAAVRRPPARSPADLPGSRRGPGPGRTARCRLPPGACRADRGQRRILPPLVLRVLPVGAGGGGLAPR